MNKVIYFTDMSNNVDEENNLKNEYPVVTAQLKEEALKWHEQIDKR